MEVDFARLFRVRKPYGEPRSIPILVLMLVILLRIIGTTSSLALAAVVLPYDWMNGIHQWLGMGTLPSDPIVGYLARTLSAFYALLGGLLWVLSFDTLKYRTVIQYLGYGLLSLGIVILIVDYVEGMPTLWKWIEGPVSILYLSLIHI